MFFGITINPSMYTQGDFWCVTQELFQPDGQTSSNCFLASQVTHLCTFKVNFVALLRNWFNLMAKHPLIENKIHMMFDRIGKSIL
jgi:uncharacterized membrane protein